MKDIDAVLGQYRATKCEWSTGEKLGFFHKTCGANVIPEKCYCDKHMKEAYYVPKKEQENK